MTPESLISSDASTYPNELRTSEPLSLPLTDYIFSYGIDIKSTSLSPEEVKVFYLAQRLDGFIQDLEIPYGKKRDETEERQLTKVTSETSSTEDPHGGYTKSLTPQDNYDVEMIKNIQQLPSVLPVDMALLRSNPTLFVQKIANKTLLVGEWHEVDDSRDQENKDPETWDVEIENSHLSNDRTQHMYSILDISKSMTKAGDGRDTMARALTLAFLHRGYRQNALLLLRPFAFSPYELSKGKTQRDFIEIANRIHTISMNNVGGTNILRALEQAKLDFFYGEEFERADILLITDGEANITYNPLHNINLHTVLLGHGSDNQQLKNISKTYRRLKMNNLPENLKPTTEEIKDLKDMVSMATSQVSEIDESNIQSTKNTIDYINGLIQTYQSFGISELENQRKDITGMLKKLASSKEIKKLIASNEKNKERTEQKVEETELDGQVNSAKVNEILEQLRSAKRELNQTNMDSTYGKHETEEQIRQRVDINRSKVKVRGKFGQPQVSSAPRFKLAEWLARKIEAWIEKNQNK